jgi:predicted O-methyltransferase YrrM
MPSHTGVSQSINTQGPSFVQSYAKALVACGHLFSVGFLSAGNRRLIEKLPRHLGFGEQPPTPGLPQAPLASILTGVPVVVKEAAGVDGNVSVIELLVLATQVRRLQATRIFEIGTFDGRTTLNFAANAPDAEVHTLDLPQDQQAALTIKIGDEKYIEKPTSGRRFLDTSEAARIVQHYGDSATFDYTPFTRTMDFIFVDGAHSTEYVRNDTEKALQMVRPGGVIAWHDYGTGQVTEALDHLQRTHPALRNLKRVEQTSLAILQT